MSETKTPDWADERRPAVTASLGRGRLSKPMTDNGHADDPMRCEVNP